MGSVFSTGESNMDVQMSGESSIEIVTDATNEKALDPELQKRITRDQLQKAAMEGNWEAAREIFAKDREAMTASLSLLAMTPLHLAASCGRSDFVEKLVKLLPRHALERVDQLGCTALHHVALAANVRAADAMVKKNPKLPHIGDAEKRTPILYAAQWRHPAKAKEMIEFLYSVTEDEPCKPFTGDFATRLILAITASGSHDVALRLLNKHPELALSKDEDGRSVLHVLARQPSAFNDPKLSVWQWARARLIGMHTETKQRSTSSIALVDFVCTELRKKSPSDIMDFFFPAIDDDHTAVLQLDTVNRAIDDHTAVLQLATVNGVFGLVQRCLCYFPNIIWYSSNNNRLLFHDAIEHRHVEIFNYLIRLIGENTKAYADAELEDKNNTLHLAALLPSSPQLLSVPDPAFQMQRELQWFKAVEAIVYDDKKIAKNKYKQTPRELFFKSHAELLKNAKDWMKNTSDSCMVVAALVTTVAFAAMITVPGGNDSGTGIPILSRQKLFVAFSISNAVSMISSTLSLLMFLSVQTSRETEDDFLESLPNTLLKGLICLFIGVATMMIAFGTAIGLSLQKRVNWAYIPITVLACCPALIFTKLQFPLFVKTLQFTPGPGKYQHKTKSKLCSRLKDKLA